jgi:hypothetical protein
MESPMVFAVMLVLMAFRTSIRAATIVALGVAEIGTWIALAAVGVVMGCQWMVGRVLRPLPMGGSERR